MSQGVNKKRWVINTQGRNQNKKEDRTNSGSLTLSTAPNIQLISILFILCQIKTVTINSYLLYIVK